MSDRISPDVDLTNCDREPIHQLGFIQDFGALVALTSDWNISRLSANIGEIFRSARPIEVGDRLADHISPDAMDRLRESFTIADRNDGVERIFGLRLDRSQQHFDCAIHRSGDTMILEIERDTEQGTIDHTSSVRPIMEKLGQFGTVDGICKEAARQLKQILGFDRVMVYRFHPDESGEVIAEAREERLESFLNLRYPKTDIPQQARRLYLRNLFRIISDVNAEPVPIQPQVNLGGEPLDLSMSTLRAVSPIHIEYLQNMGVGASLSISIVIGGKLWGLFACHHYSPMILSYPRRTMAELFSQLFSLHLEMTLTRVGDALKDQGKQLHDRLMARMAAGSSLAENMPILDEVIGDIIPHDGSCALVDGVYTSRGTAPTEEQFKALVPALNTAAAGKIVHSDSLKEIIPQAAAFEDLVVGAMIIPVSRRPRDYFVLWRRDLPHTVTWAGNPEKPVQSGPNGDRLTPRQSFAEWKQSVTGRSAPWREEELSIAENIRVTLLEVILRITDESMQERIRSQERQELLIAELNHRVRNILTLIRSLISQSKGDARSVEDFADIVGGRIRALAMAHDAITREQWSPSSLHKLIRAEAEAYLNGKTDRVLIDGEDALVAPEAYTVIALVLHEMMTNSAKYGSLCDSRGSLSISTEVDRYGDLRIGWRESGGPPVKAPTRRGFGSTIIEKSIPFELKGEASIRYDLSGVEADFTIPAKHISEIEAPRERREGDVEAEATPTPAYGLEADGPILLVEDNMIIAMDGEEILNRMGYEKVVVASSVAQALEAISEKRPALGLLDFNLGDESSEFIARKLEELGVPYWFVTGYGDALDQKARGAARGVLQKPYTAESLEAMLSEEAE